MLLAEFQPSSLLTLKISPHATTSRDAGNGSRATMVCPFLAVLFPFELISKCRPIADSLSRIPLIPTRPRQAELIADFFSGGIFTRSPLASEPRHGARNANLADRLPEMSWNVVRHPALCEDGRFQIPRERPNHQGFQIQYDLAAFLHPSSTNEDPTKGRFIIAVDVANERSCAVL